MKKFLSGKTWFLFLFIVLDNITEAQLPHTITISNYTLAVKMTDADNSEQDDGIDIDKFNFSGTTDYFRSVNSGNWSNSSTWESSPDNSVWSAATISPTSGANTITIMPGHTVTVTGNTSADQVIVANGAILEHFSGTFTIDDGVGHDIDVRGGGVFILSGASTSPGFSAPAARINIDTGGILRISAGGLTGIGTGVNATNYIYQHQSILEWTLGAGFSFSTSGVTYFPNAGALTVPIFRTTNPTAINVGGNSFTRINGVFECNGATVNWINTGLKVFRNGIRGPGTMNGLASGKFFIDGVSAELGGTGAFLLPTFGMDVGPNTLVTLTSDKTLTGEITLQPNSYIEPGIFDLTVTGTVTGGSATSFVRTLDTGKLTLSNVGASGKTFAIGNLTYNPVFISNILTGEIADFSARVENGINPAISNPAYAVLRTWNITSAETLNDVTLSFGYFAGDGGALFNYTDPLEAAAYINGTWNIVQSGIIPSGTYQAIVSPVDVFNAGLEIPFVLGNLGSILSVDYFITANAQKINGSASIRWKVLKPKMFIHTRWSFVLTTRITPPLLQLCRLPVNLNTFTKMQTWVPEHSYTESG